jgi:hypothetical protein
MTIVGKVLVFLNLVFSLVVGGLVMMVYATSTNWEDHYTKLKAQYQAANADREQMAQDMDNLRKDAANKLTDANNKLAAAEKARKDAETERDTKAAELATIKQKDRKDAADIGTVNLTSQASREAVKELETSLDKARKDIQTEIEAKNKERAARIAAEVNAKVLEARASDLEKQTRELMKDLARARAGTATASRPKLRGQENPPPDNVQARIVRLDEGSDLMTISAGSDNGLAAGHTLQVFRLDPIPEQSKYLGTIEILSVTKNEAVARPVRKNGTPMKEGDRVAARILGG